MNSTLEDTRETSTTKQNASTEQARQLAEVGKLMDSLLNKGLPLYLQRGLKKENIDALYFMAYNFYEQGQCEEAWKVFQAMVFYDHTDKRGWIGAGACAQRLKKFDMAVAAYSFVFLLDKNDPTPAFHSADCYIALKDFKRALAALEAVILMSGNAEEYAVIKSAAQGKRDALMGN